MTCRFSMLVAVVLTACGSDRGGTLLDRSDSSSAGDEGTSDVSVRDSSNRPDAGTAADMRMSFDAAQADLPAAIDGTCFVDMIRNLTVCAPPFTAMASAGHGFVTVAMPDASHVLMIDFEVCDPSGWIADIGDSISNDGGGGDGSHSSNDAEVHIVDTDLTIIGNDDAINDPDRNRIHPDFLLASGCQDVVATISDGTVVMESGAQRYEYTADTLLRINPPTDSEGVPDNLWYIGFNRVVSASSSRTGTGATTATLRVEPL